MRTHAKDLPTTQEIQAMMAVEAQRTPASDMIFANFDVVKKWLTRIGIESDVFERKTIESVNEEVAKIKMSVVSKTLEIQPLDVLQQVQDYLGEEDEMEKCDIGFVFGGRTVARADKGAELYLAGYVKKLIMCGKSPNYTAFFDAAEAVVFQRRAIELGVLEKDIIVEEESINIPSNVRGGLNKLDELGVTYGSMIQIISWYANRRAWCTLKKYLRPGVKLLRINASLPVDSAYHLNEWFKTDVGIEIIFNEFVKMKHQSLTERA